MPFPAMLAAMLAAKGGAAAAGGAAAGGAAAGGAAAGGGIMAKFGGAGARMGSAMRQYGPGGRFGQGPGMGFWQRLKQRQAGQRRPGSKLARGAAQILRSRTAGRFGQRPGPGQDPRGAMMPTRTPQQGSWQQFGGRYGGLG
jgi:hypothetical protein